MQRPIGRLRSIAVSLCKSRSRDNGNLIQKFESWKPLTSISGPLYFGYGDGEQSTLMPLQAQTVDAVRLGQRSKASDLLSSLSNGNHPLRATDFVYILKYCAKSPDPLFVMETWKLMEEKNVGVNDSCCLLVVQALCRGGYLEEAYNLIKFLGENTSLSPILPIYNSFLGACTKMRSLRHANWCLDLMEHKLLGKNEITYTELLKLAVWQQNLFAVHELWQDYLKHYKASILSLRKFIWSFIRLKDLEASYEALQYMVSLALDRKFFIRKTAKGRLQSTQLDIPIPLKGELLSRNVSFEDTKYSSDKKLDADVCSIEQCTVSDVENREPLNVRVGLLNNYKSVPAMKILIWSFSDVIYGCEQAKNGELAEKLMLQMKSLGLQPSNHTYDGFVRAVTKTKGINAGMEMLKEMQTRNMKPPAATLAALSVQSSKALELDLAESLLHQISECPYPYPYNAFLEACDISDQPERAVLTLAKMKELKLKPDIRTYELLFSLFGNVYAPYEKGNILSQVDSAKRINAIERDMAKNGIKHSSVSMRNLLKALGAEGMIRELLQYLSGAENIFVHSDTCVGTHIYNTVLHSLVEAGEGHMAINIFKNLKSWGIQPDASTYTIMIDCHSSIGGFKFASALVSMMIRDGFFPQTTTYTALIKGLLDEENFDEALNLLERTNSEGNQLDVLFFNTFLKKACEKGRIDVLELIVEIMQQAKVHPDPSTCGYVFSAYADRSFHSTAIEALQVLSMRIISEEESSLQEMKVEIEDDCILSEDSETESRILELFRDSEENFATALLNLRWCAMLGFPISWSPDQSPWARRLATTYTARKYLSY